MVQDITKSFRVHLEKMFPSFSHLNTIISNLLTLSERQTSPRAPLGGCVVHVFPGQFFARPVSHKRFRANHK